MWDEYIAWAPPHPTHHSDSYRNEHKISGKPVPSLLELLENEVSSHKVAVGLGRQPRDPLPACPHYDRGSARGVLAGVMTGDTH